MTKKQLGELVCLLLGERLYCDNVCWHDMPYSIQISEHVAVHNNGEINNYPYDGKPCPVTDVDVDKRFLEIIYETIEKLEEFEQQLVKKLQPRGYKDL